MYKNVLEVKYNQYLYKVKKKLTKGLYYIGNIQTKLLLYGA